MKIKKLSALLVSAVLCAGMAAPAFAFEGEATPVEQPILPEVVEDVVTVTDETSGALTPEGNLTLVDDYQIKCRTRFRYQRDELLPGTIRIIGVVIVHQCQIALRGQCAGGFIRDGNNIFLHDFRQNRRFHRRGIIPISECRSCHADAQHRRQQQRTNFLKSHR